MRFLIGSTSLSLLFICIPVRADRFINTGAGTINTCDSVTRVGIGIVDPSITDPHSGLALGWAGDNYPASRMEFGVAPGSGLVTGFIDMNLEGGTWPVMRFLGGANSYSSYRAAEINMTTGDFLIAGVMQAQDYYTFHSGCFTCIPDYVFEPGYKIQSLEETEKFVQTNKHLPGIPSGAELQNGMALGDMNLRLLKQIEELTLHAIDQEKRIKNLEQKLLDKKEKP